MPLAQFVECVKSGGFIDYDGTGYYANDHEYFPDYSARPSEIKSGQIKGKKHKFTHVLWFNR